MSREYVNILNDLGVRSKYFPPSKHINQTTRCFQKLVFMLPKLIISISSKSKVLKKILNKMNFHNDLNNWMKRKRLFTLHLDLS